MPYCKKCIMPNQYPGVVLNKEGICNLCLNFQSPEPLGEKELVQLINSIKRDSKYDCVVPLSGGKDSTFILYYVKKNLNLNPVAVNYDSGMQSEIAMQNQRNACKILNVPLIIRKADIKIQKRKVKAMLKVGERLNQFVLGCGGCVPILQTVTVGYAENNNIPIVFDGGSITEHDPDVEDKKLNKFSQLIIGRLLVLLGKKSRKRKLPTLFQLIFGWKPFNLVKYIELFKYCLYNTKLNNQMKLGNYQLPPFGYRKHFNNGKVTIIRFSEYIEWPENEVVNLLKKELKWDHPPGQDKRFDCLLHCLVEHSSLQNNGISGNGVKYANLVRSGLLSRDEAIYKENVVRNNLTKELIHLAHIVNLKKFKIPKISK